MSISKLTWPRDNHWLLFSLPQTPDPLQNILQSNHCSHSPLLYPSANHRHLSPGSIQSSLNCHSVNKVFLKLSVLCFPLYLGWNPALIETHKTSKSWPSPPTTPCLTYSAIVTPTSLPPHNTSGVFWWKGLFACFPLCSWHSFPISL